MGEVLYGLAHIFLPSSYQPCFSGFNLSSWLCCIWKKLSNLWEIVVIWNAKAIHCYDIVLLPLLMADVKTEQLGLRITPSAKALLREAAAKEHRSASNMVEHLILEYCEKNNIVAGVNKPSTESGKTTS